MTPEDIKQAIESKLTGAIAKVHSDDGHHFAAEVIYAGFAGKSLVEQHKIVYAAIGSKVGTDIHALTLNTKVK